MVIKDSSPFGSWTRTRVLLALRLLSESYPRELARLLALVRIPAIVNSRSGRS